MLQGKWSGTHVDHCALLPWCLALPWEGNGGVHVLSRFSLNLKIRHQTSQRLDMLQNLQVLKGGMGKCKDVYDTHYKPSNHPCRHLADDGPLAGAPMHAKKLLMPCWHHTM